MKGSGCLRVPNEECFLQPLMHSPNVVVAASTTAVVGQRSAQTAPVIDINLAQFQKPRHPLHPPQSMKLTAADLLNSIRLSDTGLTLAELLVQYTDVARRTAQRLIAKMIAQGQVTGVGEGRARRYFGAGTLADTGVPHAGTDTFPSFVPLSADSQDLLVYVDQPVEARRPWATNAIFWMPTAPTKPGTCPSHYAANCTRWAEPPMLESLRARIAGLSSTAC